MEVYGAIILDGVTRKLKEAYPQLKIYTERVNEGIKLPCFIVRQIGMNQKNQLRKRYQRTYNIIVVYHPQTNITTSNTEGLEIVNDICEHLKFIKVGNFSEESDNEEYLIRGWNINSYPVNGDIQVSIGYRLDMSDAEVENLMQSLIHNNNMEV